MRPRMKIEHTCATKKMQKHSSRVDALNILKIMNSERQRGCENLKSEDKNMIQPCTYLLSGIEIPQRNQY